MTDRWAMTRGHRRAHLWRLTLGPHPDVLARSQREAYSARRPLVLPPLEKAERG